MNGQLVGSELKLEKPQQQVALTARLNSIIPVDHWEAACNGKLVQELRLDVARVSADIRGTIPVKQSGWCVPRASSQIVEYPVLDKYAYATTSPIYINVAGAKPRSPEDAKYFAAWIVRTIEITAAYRDWNSAQEQQLVLLRLNEAKQIHEKME